jgi:hypothetical protein
MRNGFRNVPLNEDVLGRAWHRELAAQGGGGQAFWRHPRRLDKKKREREVERTRKNSTNHTGTQQISRESNFMIRKTYNIGHLK